MFAFFVRILKCTMEQIYNMDERGVCVCVCAVFRFAANLNVWTNINNCQPASNKIMKENRWTFVQFSRHGWWWTFLFISGLLSGVLQSDVWNSACVCAHWTRVCQFVRCMSIWIAYISAKHLETFRWKRRQRGRELFSKPFEWTLNICYRIRHVRRKRMKNFIPIFYSVSW